MKAITLALLLMMITLAGCGGGGGTDPLLVESTAYLSSTDQVNKDGSLFDYYTFKATRDGLITVTMSSADMDSYVLVYTDTNETTEIGANDDGGTGNDASLSFQARKGYYYTAKFTTYGEGAVTGPYIYTIKEVDVYQAPVKMDDGKTPAKPAQDPAMKRAAR